MPQLDTPTLRAIWCRAHGLDGPPAANLRTLLSRIGWVRTLGGVDAYLTMRARSPHLTADAVHAAMASGDIAVVPAARGCIYVVSGDDAPLARALARDLATRRMVRERAKAGLPDDEVARLSAAILERLSSGPATTAELRADLPEGLVRSLGPAGKKVGLSSNLPPTVRVLEFEGRIIRRSIDDRLVHEKYRWHLAPHDTPSIDPRPAAERHADLLRRVLGWSGPCTVDALAAFTGLGKRVVRTALAGSDILWHDTPTGPAAALPATSLTPEPTGNAHFLAGLDTLFAMHGGPPTFIQPADADRPCAPWGRQKGRTWGTVGHALSRAIVVDGTIAGAWEADPDTRSVVVTPFSPGLPEHIAQQAHHLASFIWDGAGTGYAFSIDSLDRLRARRDLLG